MFCVGNVFRNFAVQYPTPHTSHCCHMPRHANANKRDHADRCQTIKHVLVDFESLLFREFPTDFQLTIGSKTNRSKP